MIIIIIIIIRKFITCSQALSLNRRRGLKSLGSIGTTVFGSLPVLSLLLCPDRVRSTAMSVSVCVFVCLSATVSQMSYVQTSRNFLYMLSGPWLGHPLPMSSCLLRMGSVVMCMLERREGLASCLSDGGMTWQRSKACWPLGWLRHVMKAVARVGGQTQWRTGSEAAISDCLVFIGDRSDVVATC